MQVPAYQQVETMPPFLSEQHYAHVHPYLLCICESISLNEHGQDVKYRVRALCERAERVCTGVFYNACACVYTCAIAGA